MSGSSKFYSLSRRDWLRTTLQSGLAGSVYMNSGAASGNWFPALLDAETSESRKAKHVIFLWLNGGPATIDLWDLKSGHENGGPFKEIQTRTPGIKVSEHLPQIANWSNDIAILRSLTSKEGDHSRARQFVHTGYTPQPAIFFPLLGSLIAQEFADDQAEIPEFVNIVPDPALVTTGSGFLGPRFAPLNIGKLGDEVSDLIVPDLEPGSELALAGQDTRMQLLNAFNRQFRNVHQSELVSSIESATERAVRMMDPSSTEIFQLAREPMKLREQYGMNVFGQGCLLARRLVERGVRFVEVSLDGWDTHSDNFNRVRTLSQTLDQALATLMQDLKDRGLLESTLIVCMGEFGRTPKINGNTGRDHWPGGWGALLAGGGCRGGQTIGRTSDDGMSIEDRPVTIPDLIATTCSLLGVDPMKQNMSNVGRPIRIADPEAIPLTEII